MNSITLKSAIYFLTLMGMLSLGTVARGQFKTGAFSASMSVDYELEFTSSSGGYALSGGILHSLFIEYAKSIQKAVSPGFMYVAHSSLRGRRFSFLCVIEHTSQGSEEDMLRTEMQVMNSQAMVSQWFLIKDVICRLEYELDTHPEKTETEILAFGLKEIDLQKGRVFYIDLRKSPAQVTQLALKLPKSRSLEKDTDLIKAAIQNWQENGDLTHQGNSFLFEASPVAAQKPRKEDHELDE